MYRLDKLECEAHLLLHCEDEMTLPPTSTSGKGEPLANMARPPVHRWACSALHSDLDSRREIKQLIKVVPLTNCSVCFDIVCLK